MFLKNGNLFILSITVEKRCRGSFLHFPIGGTCDFAFEVERAEMGGFSMFFKAMKIITSELQTSTDLSKPISRKYMPDTRACKRGYKDSKSRHGSMEEELTV